MSDLERNLHSTRHLLSMLPYILGFSNIAFLTAFFFLVAPTLVEAIDMQLLFTGLVGVGNLLAAFKFYNYMKKNVRLMEKELGIEQSTNFGSDFSGYNKE